MIYDIVNRKRIKQYLMGLKGHFGVSLVLLSTSNFERSAKEGKTFFIVLSNKHKSF